MKISGGELRGRSLKVAAGVRPTGGRTREALFSRWQSTILHCEFLDLFAGSGAVGLEAVSRGADHVVQIEREAKVLGVLEANIERLAPGRCTVLRWSLPKLPTAVLTRESFGHVFADPPYDFEGYEVLLAQVEKVLTPGGEAAIEHSIRRELECSSGLRLTAAKTYGESQLSFYEVA